MSQSNNRRLLPGTVPVLPGTVPDNLPQLGKAIPTVNSTAADNVIINTAFLFRREIITKETVGTIGFGFYFFLRRQSQEHNIVSLRSIESQGMNQSLELPLAQSELCKITLKPSSAFEGKPCMPKAISEIQPPITHNPIPEIGRIAKFQQQMQIADSIKKAEAAKFQQQMQIADSIKKAEAAKFQQQMQIADSIKKAEAAKFQRQIQIADSIKKTKTDLRIPTTILDSSVHFNGLCSNNPQFTEGQLIATVSVSEPTPFHFVISTVKEFVRGLLQLGQRYRETPTKLDRFSTDLPSLNFSSPQTIAVNNPAITSPYRSNMPVVVPQFDKVITNPIHPYVNYETMILKIVSRNQHSAWTFRHGTDKFNAEVDSKVLTKARQENISVRPGSSIKVEVRVKTEYCNHKLQAIQRTVVNIFKIQ
jgi:hypothetical protein